MTKWQMRRLLILWSVPVLAGVLLILFPLDRVVMNGQDVLGTVLMLIGIGGVALDEGLVKDGAWR